MGIGERLMHAWNAFRNNRDPTEQRIIDRATLPLIKKRRR